MALFSSKGGVKAPPQSSRPQDTRVGSSSRPTPSKIKIDTSAPEDPRTLGRAPKGWLK